MKISSYFQLGYAIFNPTSHEWTFYFLQFFQHLIISFLSKTPNHSSVYSNTSFNTVSRSLKTNGLDHGFPCSFASLFPTPFLINDSSWPYRFFNQNVFPWWIGTESKPLHMLGVFSRTELILTLMNFKSFISYR